MYCVHFKLKAETHITHSQNVCLATVKISFVLFVHVLWSNNSFFFFECQLNVCTVYPLKEYYCCAVVACVIFSICKYIVWHWMSIPCVICFGDRGTCFSSYSLLVLITMLANWWMKKIQFEWRWIMKINNYEKFT